MIRDNLIKNVILPGCYDNIAANPCDCHNTPCQVGVEFYTDRFEVKSDKTVVDFGLTLNQYRRDDVRARRLGLIGEATPISNGAGNGNHGKADSDPAPEPSNIFRPNFALPSKGKYPSLSVRISGFPSTSKGAAISLDLYFTSIAYREGKGYFISNTISRETGFRNLYVSSTSAARSGDFNLDEGAAAIAWTAYEAPFAPTKFDQSQSAVFPLQDVGDHSYSADRVGILEEATIIVHYQGEVILNSGANICADK